MFVLPAAGKPLVKKHLPPGDAAVDWLTPRFPPGTRILFQGDSITDGGRGHGDDPNHIFGQDYAYLIAARCGAHFPDQNWTFLNRGISGNTVSDLAGRWQNDALNLKPDILSVLVGVNDAGSVVGSSGAGGITAAQYEQVYDGLLQQALAANPNIKFVLGEPFVAQTGHTLENPILWNAEVKSRQAAVERLAAKYHAPVVHYQKLFDDAIAQSRQPVTYWIWDGIHPTYAGHELMAEEWLRTVNQFYFSGKPPSRPLAAVAVPMPAISLTSPGDAIQPVGDPTLPDSGAATDASQGVDKAIDGTGEKYYNRSRYGGAYAGSGYLVTPAAGAAIVTGLSVTSGDDMPGRDPASFSLFGSNDGGKSFVSIVVGQAIPPFTDRHQNQRLGFTNANAYTTYKLIFPTVSGGPDMQVEEADILAAPPPGMQVAPPLPPPPGLALWYEHPAASGMNEALPIGNGRMGGLIYGGTASERIALNEDSLWTGADNPSGDYGQMGGYQLLGDLHLALPDQALWTQYQRSLDIGNALAHVTYQVGGVTFHREYFASHPDQVLVERLTADKPGAYTGTIALTDAHGSPSSAAGNTIMVAGKLSNGMGYETQVRLLADGGTVTAESGTLKFTHCNSLTLLIAAGTSYAMDYSKRYLGDDPHARVTQQLQAASAKPYEVLKAAHLHDFHSLFHRVELSLGTSPAARLALPTDARKVLATDGSDPELETLMFQFGRYLLISCSRPGSLPANLQGLWNDRNDPEWYSDYHTNINVQMNYWPAEVTNLSECHLPFLDLVVSQIPAWRLTTQTAPEYALAPGVPVRGFALRTSHNITGGMGWNWDKTANAWYCQHFWEHYAFTGDKQYLRTMAYPVLKETTEFWEDHLKALPDGRLVVPQGWSPEHGPVEDGVSYNQEIVWDLFTNYLEASRVLGVDAQYRAKIAMLREKLVVPKIGKWGQLQEWMEDVDDPNDHHRHTSHLFGVFPGRQFTLDATPDMVQAAKVSLVARTDGGDAREWSFAWRTALFARMGDGDDAHREFDQLFSNRNTCLNLFCQHPPMQADGNFGITAGVAEMLLQSEARAIHLLPALPTAWANGHVNGLRARGGFTVSQTWQGEKLKTATILSSLGGTCTLRYGTLTRDFPTQADHIYTVNGDLTPVSPAGQPK